MEPRELERGSAPSARGVPTAEAAVSDDRLAGIVRAIPEIALVFDEDGRYLEVLAGDDALLYATRDALIGRTLHEILPQDVADVALRQVRDALRTGTVQVLEYRLDVLAGPRWFEGRCGPLPPGPDGKRRAIWVARDVTTRKETEHALRRSEARLQTVVESLPFDVWLLEADERYGLVNSTARRNWRGDAVGKTPRDVAPSAEVLAHWEATNARARAGEVVREEVDVRVGGETRHLLSIVCPVDSAASTADDATERVDWSEEGAREGADGRAILGINIDLTAQKDLADRLQQAQRLESIGRLAGGIAHDFNNIMTSVVGSITLARLSAREHGDIDDLLAGAERECLRARGLTQQLLTFSRGGAPIKAAGSLDTLVRETAEFVLHGSSVRCVVDVQEDLWPVQFDEGQMRQVFTNLLVNAVQAMPSGGDVRISARNVTVPPDGRDEAEALAPGRWVLVDVCDAGSGIEPENLARVFDPYFTTKTAASGLGLATSYTIVRRHGGTLTVESEPGGGATFRLHLPEDTAAASPAPAPRQPSAAGRAGSGRILVMDDEPTVREAVARMLGHLGYGTEVVEDGESAVERYRAALEAGEPFDLVIMDLTVPGGMSGRETASVLRSIAPDARLVASSGYSSDPVMSQPGRYGFDAILPKPYLLGDLEAVLQKVLSSAS